MESEANYLDSLREWCRADENLGTTSGAALGRAFLARGLSPDEIVEMHAESVLKTVRPSDARGIVAAQQFLLDVMIAYGSAHLEQNESDRATADAEIARERQGAQDARAEARQHLELLANITHELGTPLTVIQGNVAVLRRFERVTDLLPSEIALREADIDAAIERMGSLREQLMAANRQPQPLELVPLLLDHQVDRAARWAEAAIQEKGLELRLGLDCGGLMISADEQALQSILGNLISNAIRYTAPGGSITLTTRAAGPCLMVEVTDSGIGIAPEAQDRVFDRFYRSAEAKKLSGFGLGLGLWLTKGLVEAMNATITLRSAPGQGSTFSIAFPITAGQ